MSQTEIDPIEYFLSRTSPRNLKMWECCIDAFYTKVKSNENGIVKEKGYLENAVKKFEIVNGKTRSLEYYFNEFTETKEKIIVNEYHFNHEKSKEKIRISIANTEIKLDTIYASIRRENTIDSERFYTLGELLKQTRKEKADVFILPENSVPFKILPSLAKFVEKNKIAIIAGLEHLNINGIVYNFIVTIIPFSKGEYQDALVFFRLKNHYSHGEQVVIKGFGFQVPTSRESSYDLFKWRGLYFAPYYCFELADSLHRCLFKGKVDLIVASEWNKDIPYFSNIVESLSRDLHCYVAQVNNSKFGDSRITQPSQSALKDLLKLKGGINHTVVVEEINLKRLRDFQLKSYELSNQENNKEFKPLPPDWKREDVLIRVEGKNFFEHAK